MEVILLQKVANLGNIGDRVKVKSGYAPQLPAAQGQGHAGHAGQCHQVRGASRRAGEGCAGAAVRRAGARRRASTASACSITAKAGTEGKLFGSVGTADIAEAATAAGHTLSAGKCACPPARLRTVGDHVVSAASAHRRRRRAARHDHRRRAGLTAPAGPEGGAMAGPQRLRHDAEQHRRRCARPRIRSKRSRPCSAACSSTPPPGTRSATSSPPRISTAPTIG